MFCDAGWGAGHRLLLSLLSGAGLGSEGRVFYTSNHIMSRHWQGLGFLQQRYWYLGKTGLKCGELEKLCGFLLLRLSLGDPQHTVAL